MQVPALEKAGPTPGGSGAARRFAKEESRDRASGVGSLPCNPSGNDVSVVEDKEVIGLKKAGEIADAGVLEEHLVRAADNQQARRIARVGGAHRDQIGRQVIVKIGGAEHGLSLSLPPLID